MITKQNNSNKNIPESGVVAHTCNLSTREVRTGRGKVGRLAWAGRETLPPKLTHTPSKSWGATQPLSPKIFTTGFFGYNKLNSYFFLSLI